MEPAKKPSKKVDFPTRPSVSKNFNPRKINLVSNHFSLSLSKKQEHIHLYSIAVFNQEEETIPEDDRATFQRVMGSIKKALSETFQKTYLISGRNLWSLASLKDTKTFETTIDKKKFYVKILKTKESNLKPEIFSDNEQASSARMFMNVLIKRFFKVRKFLEWGLNVKFYDPNSRVNLKQSDNVPLEVFRGFKTSCEVYIGNRLKVLVDFSSRLLRMDNVLDYMNTFGGQEEIEADLIGRSVVANYGNFRMWRITGIDWNKNPLSTFIDQDGKEVSLVQYYKQKYNIEIKDKKQPLLINERKNKVTWIIPELMRMTGMTDEMRNNFKVMKAVAQYTRLDPNNRMEKITSVTNDISAYLDKEFGIKMDTSNQIEGIQLSMPTLTLGKKSFVPEKGNYQLRDPVFKPTTFSKKKWLLVLPQEYQNHENGDYGTYFVQKLQAAAGAYAIRVEEPAYCIVKGKSPKLVQDAIRNNVTPDTMIVVCIYPKIAKKGWYRALKDVCCKELGVPSQGVLAETLDNEKGIMSVASKILIQMNVKVGMEPWITSTPAGLPQKTMIIGADVFHKADKQGQSCVGFCASIDPQLGKYYCKVHFQKPGQELMESLGPLVKGAVNAYYKVNNYLPEYIIFYRDGVAENQIPMIVEFETVAILKAFTELNEKYKPKFAEFVVTKRIDDRFFVENKGKGNKIEYSNPPAGTLVADNVVSNHFDFFLIAQNVTQGTCTPTHYRCVYNNTELPADVFYQLTYNQCYNYYNWNGSVRVPAACQYAHKLAYLVGQTLREGHHSLLDNKLFFL